MTSRIGRLPHWSVEDKDSLHKLEETSVGSLRTGVWCMPEQAFGKGKAGR